MNELSLGRRLSDVVAEYEYKREAIPEVLKDFQKAGSVLMTAVAIEGKYGRVTLDTGRVAEHAMADHLLKSAWLYVYDRLQISYVASADDKRRFEQSMASPPPFTMENLVATFGDYIRDPRGNILRGLAEVFCGLDPSYKSHDKVKIGVSGLPKRVVLQNVGAFGSYGRDRLVALLNALAVYQGKPLVEHEELSLVDALHNHYHGHTAGSVVMDGTHAVLREGDERLIPDRGVTVKKFKNGNAHVVFSADTLLDINRALAEYYGDVLPDTTEEKPARRATGTDVAKDLQYYPTPEAVAERVVASIYGLKNSRVLEPSCGCGRIMDALRRHGAAEIVGCEIDPIRAATSEAKGHKVMRMNFLETVPTPTFDTVVMNPPFYGTHYAKHVKHALKFLKPRGTLVAILPATARYDHGLLDGEWRDLPVGSFGESGTNVCTTVLTIRV